MKKFLVLALIIITIGALISCTATTSSEPTEPMIVTELAPEPAVGATSPEPLVTEPMIVTELAPEPAVGATSPEPLVIDSTSRWDVSEVDIEKEFSYVYGHLLASNIMQQGIIFEPSYFIKGSADFYNFLDPVITEEEINDVFLLFQEYLYGNLSEEAIVEGSDPSSAIPLSLLDKFSYGYGYVVMFNLQSQGIFVSLEDYKNGISNAAAEIPLPYTDEELDALFTAYEEKLMSDYFSMIEEMAQNNLAQAEAFLAQNGAEEDVYTTESGLQYRIISLGDGPLPTETDSVEVDYLITFLDGTTGDNSYARGEPSVFSLSNLIPGFVEGVMLMPVVSHYQFYLHPSLAYGEMGNESIPPNSLLIFDVELHSIVD